MHQGGACRHAHPPQTAYCRDRWMAAEESRQRIQVSQQSSSGAPEPAPDPSFNPLGDYKPSILRKRIDKLAKQIDRRDREAASASSSAKQGGKGPVRKRSDKLLLVADIQGPLVEKDNLPGYTLPPFASSSLKPADLQRIFEEQTARSARSRRKAIEDFHWVCGW